MGSRKMNRVMSWNPSLVALAVVAGTLSAPLLHAAVITDGFENPTTSTGSAIASGSSVAGYVGPLGTWSDSSGTKSAANIPTVVQGTGSVGTAGNAYSGIWFLRQVDTATTVATAATLNLNAANQIAANGAKVSFALRVDSTFNSNQFRLNATTTAGGTTPLLQVGPQVNGPTSGRVTATPFAGTTAGASVELVSSANFKADAWYLFDLTYSISNSVGTYAISVTNTSTGATAYSGTLSGNSSLTAIAPYTLSGLSLTTNSSGTGNADADAVSIGAVPEPTALVAAAGGAALVLRRRRRRA